MKNTDIFQDVRNKIDLNKAQFQVVSLKPSFVSLDDKTQGDHLVGTISHEMGLLSLDQFNRWYQPVKVDKSLKDIFINKKSMSFKTLIDVVGKFQAEIDEIHYEVYDSGADLIKRGQAKLTFGSAILSVKLVDKNVINTDEVSKEKNAARRKNLVKYVRQGENEIKRLQKKIAAWEAEVSLHKAELNGIAG